MQMRKSNREKGYWLNWFRLMGCTTFDTGMRGLNFVALVPIVRKVDNAIHRINHYRADSAVSFRNTYPLDGDLASVIQPLNNRAQTINEPLTN